VLSSLRGADLRLTPEEAASFLNVAMDLGLSPGDVAALEARTEGWIVGLQMAALALQGRVDKHRFIAAGLANREIAQRLHISVGTVKVHSSHIYGKLGVRSRTQAVAKVRALGILPDDVDARDPSARV
jgi:ATP/maltotriose-dependent transcriptional regulator MalT